MATLFKPAIRKVLDGLAATFAAASSPTVHVDRSIDQPFGNAELPATNIRVVTVSFEYPEQGVTLHRAAIDVEIATAGGSVLSIDAEQSDIAADYVAALHADRTIGGILQDITAQDMSGSEDDGSEAGIAILSYEAIFLTPLGDHRTIIGATGLIP